MYSVLFRVAETIRTSDSWLRNSRLSHSHLPYLCHPHCHLRTLTETRTWWASSTRGVESARVRVSPPPPIRRQATETISSLLDPLRAPLTDSRLQPRPSHSLPVSLRLLPSGRRSQQNTAKPANEHFNLGHLSKLCSAALFARLNRLISILLLNIITQSNLHFLPLTSVLIRSNSITYKWFSSLRLVSSILSFVTSEELLVTIDILEPLVHFVNYIRVLRMYCKTVAIRV